MRLAWFAPAHATTIADVAPLIRALRARHQIDVIDERDAHAFVWRQARAPYDLCVYELDNTPAHQFVWPYLVHYAGVTRLHRVTLQNSRAQMLEREHRLDDFAREFSFAHPGATPPVVRAAGQIALGRWPMLAVPLLASRVTVVAHAAVQEALSADYPSARVRAITPGVEPRDVSVDEIVMAGAWPLDGAPLLDALAGFAAGRPVIVIDCAETADWPSLNPQDWQPRSPAAPICIAIDPRDEEHSRRLALARLRHDTDLRVRLGTAAQKWWRTHATIERASAAFEQVLDETYRAEAPARPDGWPDHLAQDGLAVAREVLGQFGLELPF
jgi:hypothetical protein